MSFTRIAQNTGYCICRRHRYLLSHVYPASISYGRTDSFTNSLNGLSSSAVSHRRFSAETYIQYFSSDSPPIALAQSVLQNIHDTTGLPWWASIPLTTFCFRSVITLPAALYSNYILTKVENLKPEIKELSDRLRVEVSVAKKKFSWSERTAKLRYVLTMKKLVRNLYIRDNCHPLKCSIVILVQLPLWFSVSFALRNMSGAGLTMGGESVILCPELLTEGILWFSNLTLPDSTWILPISFGILNLLIIEMNTLQKSNPTKFQRMVTYFLRGVTIFMVPVAAVVPSSMCLYWVSSCVFGLAQNIVLRLPSVCRVFPSPKSIRSETPFRVMLEAARTKYSFKKKS